MYFPESEVIVRKHLDLQRVAHSVDERLSEVFSTAPLRPADFACVIDADKNQVSSVFELLAEEGLLQCEEMVECERCQNLVAKDAFRQDFDEEDECECSNCGHALRKSSHPTIIYRMTSRAASRPKPKPLETDRVALPGEEPLGERAQNVLVAMLELDLIDSDKRRSTEEIAAKALGANADANSLKSVMSELNTRELIKTKTGRNGGCWLTEKGVSRATKLRQG